MNYNTLASEVSIARVITGLKERNVEGIFVKTKAEALEKIKSFIPQGVSVMNGASKTLEEVGFVEYLKNGMHGWNNLHEGILAEKDLVKQSFLRKQATLSDYYLGSVNAIAETGELVIASNSGSQMPHIVFTSPNIIFVAGAQKIVPTREDAFRRVEEYVLPLEDKHMKDIGYGGSRISKMILFNYENPFMKRKVRLILVNEVLGY